MKLQPPITDDDIEAFLTGHLSPARLHVVEDALGTQPDLRRRVKALQADQNALRAIGADLLSEPIPDRFLTLLDVVDDNLVPPAQRRHGT